MGEDHEHEPTAWSELDWATMTPDETAANIAAMQAEAERRRPQVEARQAREAAAAEARLIDACRSHIREWREAYGDLTVEESNRMTREADARA